MKNLRNDEKRTSIFKLDEEGQEEKVKIDNFRVKDNQNNNENLQEIIERRQTPKINFSNSEYTEKDEEIQKLKNLLAKIRKDNRKSIKQLQDEHTSLILNL